MFDFVLSTAHTALAHYWPICAVIMVVAVAVTHHTRGPSQRFAIGGAIVASCIGTLIIAFSQPSSPLVRDALAAFVVALIAPGASAALGASLRSFSAVTRFTGAMIVGLLLVCVSPLFLLIVHCTSGDCLQWARGLTIRSTRTRFVTPTAWQIKLAMLLAPLRRSG